MSGVEGTPLTGTRFAGSVVPDLAGLDVRVIDRLEAGPKRALRWLSVATVVAALTSGAAAACIGGLALESEPLAAALGLAMAGFVWNLHRIGTASVGVPLWEDPARIQTWRPGAAPIVVSMILGGLLAQVPAAWIVPSAAEVVTAREENVARYRAALAAPFDARIAELDARFPPPEEVAPATDAAGSGDEAKRAEEAAPAPAPKGRSAERAALTSERAVLVVERDRAVSTALPVYAAEVAEVPLTAARVEIAWRHPVACAFVSWVVAVLVAWPALLRTLRPGALRRYELERHAEERDVVYATHAASQADAAELLRARPTFGRRALAVRFADPVFRRKELLLGVHPGTVYTDSDPLRLATRIPGLDIDRRLAAYEATRADGVPRPGAAAEAP